MHTQTHFCCNIKNSSNAFIFDNDHFVLCLQIFYSHFKGSSRVFRSSRVAEAHSIHDMASQLLTLAMTIFLLGNDPGHVASAHHNHDLRPDPDCLLAIDGEHDYCLKQAKLPSLNVTSFADRNLCTNLYEYHICRVEQTCNQCVPDQAAIVESVSKRQLEKIVECQDVFGPDNKKLPMALTKQWCFPDYARVHVDVSKLGTLGHINDCATKTGDALKQCRESMFSKWRINETTANRTSRPFCQATFDAHLCAVDWVCGHCPYDDAHDVEDELKLQLDLILHNCTDHPPEFNLSDYRCQKSYTDVIIMLAVILLLATILVCVFVVYFVKCCCIKNDGHKNADQSKKQDVENIDDSKN